MNLDNIKCVICILKRRSFVAKITILFFALSLCNGCVSYHWLLRPGATGSVVDLQTGGPIAGAQITFSRDPKFYKNWYINTNQGLRVTNTLSAADGTFCIPPPAKVGVCRYHLSEQPFLLCIVNYTRWLPTLYQHIFVSVRAI